MVSGILMSRYWDVCEPVFCDDRLLEISCLVVDSFLNCSLDPL